MRLLRHLTGRHRTTSTNRTLGLLLAFNAGAINAGGFLVVQMYTSHMSGFLSLLADNLVLGNMALVLSAVGVLWAFLSGAGTTAILVNWARAHQLRSGFALPLLLEAVLMLLFGLMGAITLTWHTVFAVPLTVLLLAFIMGLQNAVVTKLSSAQIRTTHMTGVITDLGIEMGKMLYWNRSGTPPAPMAWRPKPSCANACTAAFAPPPAPRTSCWGMSWTGRVAASTSSSRCWKARPPPAPRSATWTAA